MKTACCYSISVTAADTVLTQCYVKKTADNVTCTFTLMQTTKTMNFHAYDCTVRLQVFICYVNIRLQRNIRRICLKVPV